MGRKSGTTNKSNYHYLVEEYENFHKDKIIRKAYFKTQQDIGEFYNMNRAAIYHTMNGNTRRIKKYNFLKIEKLNPPLPIHEKVVIDYKKKHAEELLDTPHLSSEESEYEVSDESESWSE